MATSGPNYPSTGASVGGYGFWDWNNPGYITANDSAYAVATFYQECDFESFLSYELQASAYGFSIPAGSVIDGIEVVVRRYQENEFSSMTDDSITLMKTSGAVGDNKASATQWASSPESITYGGPTDLWGTTWTVSEVNNSAFGVSLRTYADSYEASAFVDYITVKVYYTSGGSGSSGAGIGSRFFMMF